MALTYTASRREPSPISHASLTKDSPLHFTHDKEELMRKAARLLPLTISMDHSGLAALQPFLPQSVSKQSFVGGCETEIGCLGDQLEVVACDRLTNGIVLLHSNMSGRRTVQWVDYYGQDIAQVKEYELSDSSDSDDDDVMKSSQSCICAIQ
ncbi:hypothetical protein O6H91_12G020900 [Diphasiastrum complanatum]|uniref:Uncharacterized protein n=2 Tax=Diphasiastrum complanatum TaxID=34168 RepID=A0ACC2BYP9_DIPCM|nr:hypothetical protein O6H91_12G007200 [Diphasiastrum complanatum]KAJ7535151.1 hypothetical protein O6H91_12G020900 [Diphasiastrum complanatum]